MPIGRWLLTAVIVLGGVGYVFRHSLFPATHVEAPTVDLGEDAPMSVTVVTAEEQFISRRFLARGTLLPRDEVLIVPQVAGVEIEEIFIELGDNVEAGQLLARLNGQRLAILLSQKAADISRAEASILQAEALAEETQAAVREADGYLQRADALSARNALSDQALEERRAAVVAARARSEAQDQALIAAGADLRRTETEREELLLQQSQLEIRATSPGMITEVNAKIGQTTGGDGTPLFRVMKDAEVEMEAIIVEMALSAITIGQPVEVTLADGNRAVEGRVRRIAPSVDPATRMGKVWISVAGEYLRAGGSAQAVFETSRHEAIVVPHMAVVQGEAGPRVLTVQDGTVSYRVVETGLNSATGIEITSGLKSGDVVVAMAGGFLREGARVSPVPIVTETAAGDFR